MSASPRRKPPRRLQNCALIFSALGDETRLTLIAKLSAGSLLSITQLTDEATVTRQAITKHLRVLQQAGLVRAVRRGRESLFHLEPKPLDDAKNSLDGISRQWDEALVRLKAFVED